MSQSGLLPSVAAPSPPGADAGSGSGWRRLAVPACLAVAGVVLFFLYLGQARRTGFGSDGAVIAQQGWDVLHGNVLLHGWELPDIAFYTIEVPEFAVLEWLRGGLDPGVIAALEALNLTVVVLLAAVVARGRAAGREGLVRALIAAGILLAPTPGPAGTLMLGNPDHLATQVPLLLVWLILDRAAPGWRVPAAVGALLAWARMSDAIVLLEGEIPLFAVCVIRMYRRRGPLRGQWYDASLAAAAVIANEAAKVALRLVHSHGGFTAFPLQETFASISAWAGNVFVTVQSFFDLYGADFSGQRLAATPGLVIPAVHLAGVALAVAALWLAVRRFSGGGLMIQVVTAAMVCSLAAYTVLAWYTAPGGAHDLMPVLPAGAVLAGRLLTAGVIRRGLVPALAVVLGLYGIFLCRDALIARPGPQIAQRQQLAAWLTRHHLRYGLSDYYAASLLSADSGGGSMVVPVSRRGGQLVLSPWNSQASWYDPARRDATFFVASQMQGCPAGDAAAWQAAARGAFGPPAATYSVAGAEVMVWHRNLLSDYLPALRPHRPPAC
jgi:hypothetical protein